MPKLFSEEVSFAMQYVESLIKSLKALDMERVAQVIRVLKSARQGQRQVFTAGNGGSAATASHAANDLMKAAAKRGLPGFRTISLSDNVPIITAVANDHEYAEIFSQQLTMLGAEGDVLIVFSGSGNSPNIVRAVQEAKHIGMTTIAFLGMGGGQIADMVDTSIVVSAQDYEPIEDIHLALSHLIASHLRIVKCEACLPDGSQAGVPATKIGGSATNCGRKAHFVKRC